MPCISMPRVPICCVGSSWDLFSGSQTSLAKLKCIRMLWVLHSVVQLLPGFPGFRTENCYASGLLGLSFCCVGFSWGLRLLLQMQRWLPRWQTCWLQTRGTPAASSPSCTSCTATPQMPSKYLQCTFCSIPRCVLCPILSASQLMEYPRHTAACRCPSFSSGCCCSIYNNCTASIEVQLRVCCKCLGAMFDWRQRTATP